MLTGAAIASQLPPQVGLPLAFVSHFALDAIPHYDGLYPYRPYKVFPVLQTVIDFGFGLLLLSTLTRGNPEQNYFVIAALIAIFPDIQAGLYLNYQFLKFTKPLVDWHIAIQRQPPTWVGIVTTLGVSLLAIWVISL
jgi:hypothetical protein